MMGKCVCGSRNLCDVHGHCVDRFTATIDGKEYGPDYVPRGLGIGIGDDMSFEYCLNCGRIQNGIFPLNPDDIEIFD